MVNMSRSAHMRTILPGVPPHTPPYTPGEPTGPLPAHSTMVYVKERPPTWEYKTLVTEAIQLPDETLLNALGAEGWELSGIAPGGDSVTFYFKRQTR